MIVFPGSPRPPLPAPLDTCLATPRSPTSARPDPLQRPGSVDPLPDFPHCLSRPAPFASPSQPRTRSLSASLASLGPPRPPITTGLTALPARIGCMPRPNPLPYTRPASIASPSSPCTPPTADPLAPSGRLDCLFPGRASTACLCSPQPPTPACPDPLCTPPRCTLPACRPPLNPFTACLSLFPRSAPSLSAGPTTPLPPTPPSFRSGPGLTASQAALSAGRPHPPRLRLGAQTSPDSFRHLHLTTASSGVATSHNSTRSPSSPTSLDLHPSMNSPASSPDH